jgi:hypothetical protein
MEINIPRVTTKMDLFEISEERDSVLSDSLACGHSQLAPI